MKPLSSAQMKKAWKNRMEFGGFTGSYKDFLKSEAERANENEQRRKDGATYADAAALLLERK